MLNRNADVLYNDVDQEKINSANPKMFADVLEFHNTYIFERHEIYKRKEIQNLPQDEWTDDEVFQKYRFTNVRREIDRESVWLIRNISENNDLTLIEKILNSILFRTFNKSSTMELFGCPIKDFDDIERYRPMFERYAELNPKYVFFTPAFNTGGLKAANAFPDANDMYECTSSGKEVKITNGVDEKRLTLRQAKDYIAINEDWSIIGLEPNMPMRMMHLVRNAYHNKLAEKILECTDQREVFDVLQEVKGFSKFLAYQVFVDLTYIPEFKFSENEFTVSGPGCHNGLEFLFSDRDGLNDEELLFWLRNNLPNIWKRENLKYDLNKLFDHLPEHDRCLNVMMLENSFCELGKYTKARKGIGRPRVTYKPTEDSNVRVQMVNECTLDEWAD